VFNPLGPAEMVTAVGRVLKEESDADGPRDGYRRGQLLSGYSVARHLAAEQAAADELRTWFRAEMADALDGDRARRLHAAGDAAAIGEAACEVLADLREAGEAGDGPRRRIHALLRALADREVAALSHPPA